MSVLNLARDERADLAKLLRELTPEQWDRESLCDGWRVRDVVAHIVSYDGFTTGEALLRFARGAFTFRRTNARVLNEYRDRGPDALRALFAERIQPRGLVTAMGGMVALVDCTIHHQDIRRPLGLPREIPPERLRAVLRLVFRAVPVRAFWRGRGLRLVATDLDWSRGRGPEVRGPGEAILMAVAGRRGAVEELTGPGQPILAARIQNPGLPGVGVPPTPGSGGG